jgi:hypothetical protein
MAAKKYWPLSNGLNNRSNFVGLRLKNHLILINSHDGTKCFEVGSNTVCIAVTICLKAHLLKSNSPQQIHVARN